MKFKLISAAAISVLFSLNSSASSLPPKPPDYASCKLIDVPDVGTNFRGTPITTTHKVIDPVCKNNLDQQYQAAVRANNMANNLVTSDNGAVVEPAKPVLQECQSQIVNGGLSVPDYSCSAENSRKQREYNDKMAVYNLVAEQQNAAIAQQQINTDARIKNSSATEQIAEAEKKANDGGQKQDQLSQMFNATSIAFGVAYDASCSSSTCQQRLQYLSAAFSVLSKLSAKQSNQDYNTANQACASYNQLASNKKECGAVPPPEDPTKPSFPYQQIDPASGTCLASAPPSCSANRQALLDKGINIRKVVAGGPNGFAGANTPYKINPDGSVTMKGTGKILSAADFEDEAAMVAAGISPADAKAIASDMYGKNGILAKAGLDTTADLKAMNSGLRSFDMGSGGGTTTVKVGTEDPDKGKLGVKDVGSGGKRGVANEGLVRNFNGDTIGIANDDIFKMMNKRYILKSAQDSFIGQ